MKYLSGVTGVETELFLGIDGTVYPVADLASARLRVVGFGASMQPGVPRYIVNELLANLRAPFLGKLDIYHPTHYRAMPMVRAKRVVATHLDCIYERFPVFKHVKEVLHGKRSLYAKADAIICISESGRQDLLSFYNVDEAKTRVIYLGVSSLPRCPAAAEQLRQQLRRDYVLFVGRRASYKNFNGLLKALHRTGLHASLDLLAVGGGPFTPEETALISELKMSDTIVHLPLASDALIGEAYAGAKVFVYPSVYEGFGIPPLEAMSLDCPVVACRAASIPEICHDAPFYFNPDDDESLDHALLSAVNDEEARRQAIERGRKVAAGYTWEKCGQETLALYRECQ
jgi:glycosyltransferase involved in cell wall biosynthesis